MEEIKFLYNEAAAVVRAEGREFLVIGDLHIGAESKFIHKGIRLYSAVEFMANKIKSLMKEFDLHNIIILGDVKDTILYPDKVESDSIKRFFSDLKDYNIMITSGNHDPHLDEIINVKIVDELLIDGFAFMHGHKFPSEAAMTAKYILAGHNHVAVSFLDKNKAFYTQKAWLVAPINARKAKEKYNSFNKNAKLVVLPAFNDLIIGMPVNEVYKDNLSPLFRNGIFDYKKAKVYSLRGELLGETSKIKRVKRFSGGRRR